MRASGRMLLDERILSTMTITTMTNTRAHHGDQASTPSMDNNNSETVIKKGETGYGDACGHSLLCAHFDRKGVNCNTPYRDCKCDKQNMDLHDTNETRSN